MKSVVGKRIFLSGLGLTCLLLAAFMPACTTGPGEATLTSAVKMKIAAGSPGLVNAVTVTTAEGVVTLTGTVDSDAIKTKVEQDAKGVEGVKSVVNNLTVKPPITFSEDSTIKNTVMANLAKKKITGVTVEVVNGEVTLKGTIERAKLQDAMMAANDAKPKKVINQLTIVRPGDTSTGFIIDQVENMRKGTVITTCPVSMYVGETRTVELVLAPDVIKAKDAEDQARKEISNQAASTSKTGSEARVESTPAQFSCFMEAKLTGQGFEVSSVTPDRQPVVLSQNTKWMWNVKAISTGDQNLSLSLNAIFENVGPEKTLSVNTLTKVVKVETLKLPWTTQVGAFISNNWQWSMTALLLPLAAWIWSQIRKKKT